MLPDDGKEVLTLAEAAVYLRVPESDVLTFIVANSLHEAAA